jgi:hypothetical protein
VESKKGMIDTAATPKITLRLVFEPPRRDLTLPLSGEFKPVAIFFLTQINRSITGVTLLTISA